MWNSSLCNFGPMFGAGHWFGGWLFPILFWGLILWVTVSLFQKIFTANKDKRHDTALAILKERYAAGEIDQSRFEEMKTAITK